jgi:hypothetical protein
MMSEAAIQKAIISYVEAVVPRSLVFAIPNAAKRTSGGHAANFVPGLRKGVFDLCLCTPGGFVAFIEVKTAKGQLSKDQEEIRGKFVSLGTPHAVVRSVEDVRAALAHWKIETRESGLLPQFKKREVA